MPLSSCAVVLLLGSWLACRARGGSAEGTPSAVCSYDASAHDALLRDHAAWCGAQSARCQRDPSLHFCENDGCLLPPVNVTGLSTKAEYFNTSPQLFCRTLTNIVWHWEYFASEKSSNVLFFVSVRRASGEGWLLHDVVSENNYTLNTDKVSDSEFEFQLRVQGYSQDSVWGKPCSSEWISLLNESLVSSPVRNVTVLDTYEFSNDYVNVTVLWEPSKEDMSCDYKIYYWASYSNTNLRAMEYHMQFTAILPYLQFNSSYGVYLYSMHLGRNKTDFELHNKVKFTFMSPTCLELWNNNLTVCSPPSPVALTVTFHEVGVELYVMTVSWVPAFLLPEEYIVSLRKLTKEYTEEDKSEVVRVNGNATSVKFENIEASSFYLVTLVASSEGGNSTSLDEYRKIASSKPQPQELSKNEIIIVITITSVTLILVLVGGGFCLFWQRTKMCKSNLQGHEYFQNSEKESSKEKKYDTAFVYYDDEWEIPEDRLILGNILGEGAFGVVRKGLLAGQTQQESCQEVAVKMLKDDPTHEDMRQFKQEISMMISVGKHPHIVSIIGCSTCSKPVRLIVEYCALGDLQNYLREIWKLIQNSTSSPENPSGQVKYAELMTSPSSTFSENEKSQLPSVVLNQMYFQDAVQEKTKVNCLQASDLLSYAWQIAKGMEFLASNRIVHRDLAARNVLVCANKIVKISDFGLSRNIYEQNVYHKQGNGKVPIKWMALESLMYQIYTTQSDIWSFGILLWEIVTLGAMPYPSTPANRIFKLLKTGYRMECPSNCSQELYNVMLLCWRAEPKDRPTFTELRNKLDTLLEDSSPQQYLNLNILYLENIETTSTKMDHPSSGSQ